MAAKLKNAAPGKKQETARPGALLFELENLAASGRSVMYDVLKSVLADKGIEVTHACFVKFCIETSAAVFLPRLLAHAKKERLSEGKLLAEINEGMALSFRDGTIKTDKGLDKTMKEASVQGLLIGCLSGLRADAAAVLAKRLGLTDRGVKLLAHQDDRKRFPSPDEWLKLAKTVGAPPTRCVALVTSALATRTALSAGMRVVALPDKFTAFEDFTGADFVCDSYGDVSLKAVAAMFGR